MHHEYIQRGPHKAGRFYARGGGMLKLTWDARDPCRVVMTTQNGTQECTPAQLEALMAFLAEVRQAQAGMGHEASGEASQE